MIRFVLKRKTFDGIDFHSDNFETIDADVPTLEQALRRGGYGGGPDNDAYDVSVLIGAELLESCRRGK